MGEDRLKKILALRPDQLTFAFSANVLVCLIYLLTAFSANGFAVFFAGVYLVLTLLIFWGVFKGRTFCKYLAYLNLFIGAMTSGVYLSRADLYSTVTNAGTIKVLSKMHYYFYIGTFGVVLIALLISLILLFQMKSLLWFKACRKARKGQFEEAETVLTSMKPSTTPEDIADYNNTVGSLPKPLRIAKWYFIVLTILLLIPTFISPKLQLFFSPDMFSSALLVGLVYISIVRKWISYIKFYIVLLYFRIFLGIIGFVLAIGVFIFVPASHQWPILFITLLAEISFALSLFELYLLDNKKSRKWYQAVRALKVA